MTTIVVVRPYQVKLSGDGGNVCFTSLIGSHFSRQQGTSARLFSGLDHCCDFIAQGAGLFWKTICAFYEGCFRVVDVAFYFIRFAVCHFVWYSYE